MRVLYDRLPAGARSAFRAWLPDPLLRWYAHRNTDVYLLSYPKCGRTWLRLMIGRALIRHCGLPEDEDLLFLRWKRRPHPALPHITVVHDGRPMLKAPEELETDKGRFREKKVIFLVRDPRDVVVSSYFEMKNRGRLFGENPYEQRQAVFDGTLSEFINRHTGGFDTIVRYYNIWAENRELPRSFLLIRYEDMKANPPAELRRVVDFLGFDEIPEATLVEAVQYASFENMRKMESAGKFQTGILRPADQANQESFKTRKGKVGGFSEYLTPEEVSTLNQKMAAQLSPYFGYQP